MARKVRANVVGDPVGKTPRNVKVNGRQTKQAAPTPAVPKKLPELVRPSTWLSDWGKEYPGIELGVAETRATYFLGPQKCRTLLALLDQPNGAEKLRAAINQALGDDPT